jgi:hypothetical protein
MDDLRISRIRIFRQECGRGHEHTRRAVAALQRANLQKGDLQRVQLAVLRQPFDSGDVTACGRTRCDATRLGRLAVDEQRAGATLAVAATVLCAGESQFVAQDAQQGAVRVNRDRIHSVVDGQRYLHVHQDDPLSKSLAG